MMSHQVPLLTNRFSSHLLSLTLPWTTDKCRQITKENSKWMKDDSTSNVSHVSRKPLKCIQVTTPYASHVVEVTFQNHCNVCDLFSNTKLLCSSLFNGGENNVIFYNRDTENNVTSRLTKRLKLGSFQVSYMPCFLDTHSNFYKKEKPIGAVIKLSHCTNEDVAR